MSETAAVHPADAHGDHPPHLAHHFDTPAQQYSSAKLGMWVFLGTEILMFGGLFCAYGVYRHNHPEVFEFAHKALNPFLGGINTIVLITSSLTMAMAVRYAQLGMKRPLLICLALTILGGAGFMGIKFIEYKTKWEHHLFPGHFNVFNAEFRGDARPPEDLAALEHGPRAFEHEAAPAVPPLPPPAPGPTLGYVDPLAETPDEAKIRPTFVNVPGLAPSQAQVPIAERITFSDLGALDQKRVNAFFSVYFFMTGLHGLHVLIGIGLILWVALRARRGIFGPRYFTPVDLVGLYWHLVDLIWIFLFPLLYLIH
ncbi:MAG TPA: cytochrome c oxidase subunit 3 family protein [Tepidisphaeraceae bacterium]|jgi:cytochrome c oxidase subunit 3